MKAEKKTNVERPSTAVTPDAGIGGAVAGAGVPHRLTLAENVILTIKLLTGLGLLGAALWGIDLWTVAK